MRKLFALLMTAGVLAGFAGNAMARPPADKPPPDRGGRVPACQLGVDLGGNQICIVP